MKFKFNLFCTLTRLNVLGIINAIASANSAALLKNFTAVDETRPNGGFPTTQYFLGFRVKPHLLEI